LLNTAPTIAKIPSIIMLSIQNTGCERTKKELTTPLITIPTSNIPNNGSHNVGKTVVASLRISILA